MAKPDRLIFNSQFLIHIKHLLFTFLNCHDNEKTIENQLLSIGIYLFL
jgi:hypothetical protein